jgi:uncharacterized protein (DUF488 family)
LAESSQAGPTIWTIGHSTHPIDEFVRLLEAHGILQLVDVRTVPRSRHNPQFDRDSLPGSLGNAGILYRHMPGLGGLRRARGDSLNTGWRNVSFRGFADYMQTAEFQDSLQKLIELAAQAPTAIMCAEAVPWRCHRSLIGDALLARGTTVLDILSSARAQPHSLTPFAKVDGTALSYPGEGGKKTGNLALKFDEPDTLR